MKGFTILLALVAAAAALAPTKQHQLNKSPNCDCIGKADSPNCDCIGKADSPNCDCIGKADSPNCDCIGKSAVNLIHTHHKEMARMYGSTKCVIFLLVAYFFVYSVAALLKMFLEWTGKTSSPILEILERGEKYVDLAPMMSVMFLATRLRAMSLENTFITLLQAEALPSELAQTSMLVASSCLVANVGLTTLMPFITGEFTFSGSTLAGVAEDRKGLAGVVDSIKSLINLAITVFMVIVVAECIKMKAPAGMSNKVSPAVTCVIALTCMYFITFGAWDLCKTVGRYINGESAEGAPRETFMSKFENIMGVTLSMMNLAPMTALLFLCVRMRSLSMGRSGPQEWAQDAMYFTTCGLAGTAILTVVGPLLFGAKVKQGLVEGDVTYEMSNTTVAAIFTGLRYAALLSVYIGLTVVVVSTFIVEPPAGKPNIPMATSIATSLILTDIYFLSYLGIWIAATLKQFLGEASWINTMTMMFDGSRTGSAFIPMTCILFLATRLRSIQVVGAHRGPQNWAQYAMWASTLAVTFASLSGFLAPITGEGGSVCKGINSFIRLFLIIGVHAGAITVVVSLFLISKKTAGDLGLKDPASWTTDTVGLTL